MHLHCEIAHTMGTSRIMLRGHSFLPYPTCACRLGKQGGRIRAFMPVAAIAAILPITPLRSISMGDKMSKKDKDKKDKQKAAKKAKDSKKKQDKQATRKS